MFSSLAQCFRQSARQFHHPRTLALTALLVALNLTLDALNIRIQLTPQLRISLGFVALAMVGMLFGPITAMTAGAASDFVGWRCLFSRFYHHCHSGRVNLGRCPLPKAPAVVSGIGCQTHHQCAVEHSAQ